MRLCASTPDIAALARAVGGPRVEITTFCRGAEDPHFVEAKPSFVRRLNRADLLCFVGLDLEVGWLPVLVRSARNPRVLPGTKGSVDFSRGVEVRDVPKGPVDRTMGDVHPHGNPHYLLDPVQAGRAAKRLTEALVALRPAWAKELRERHAAFQSTLKKRFETWKKRLEPYRGTPVVTDHKIWTYFLARFGLRGVATLEPKPGVLPTSRHLLRVVQRVQKEKARAILTVPYFDERHGRFVARKTGAKLLVLPHQPGAVPKTDTYFEWMDLVVDRLVQTLGK